MSLSKWEFLSTKHLLEDLTNFVLEEQSLESNNALENCLFQLKDCSIDKREWDQICHIDSKQGALLWQWLDHICHSELCYFQYLTMIFSYPYTIQQEIINNLKNEKYTDSIFKSSISSNCEKINAVIRQSYDIESYLPSKALNSNSFMDRLMQHRYFPSEISKGEYVCDIRQIEKDSTREIFAINNQVIKGADGLLNLIIHLYDQLYHNSGHTSDELDEDKYDLEITNEIPFEKHCPSWALFPALYISLYDTQSIKADVQDFMEMSQEDLRNIITKSWHICLRLCIVLYILQNVSRTHCGGSSFSAVMNYIVSTSVPYLIQPNTMQSSITAETQHDILKLSSTQNISQINIIHETTPQIYLYTRTPLKLISDSHPDEMDMEPITLCGYYIASMAFEKYALKDIQSHDSVFYNFIENVSKQVRDKKEVSKLLGEAYQYIERQCINNKVNTFDTFVWLPSHHEWVITKVTDNL